MSNGQVLPLSGADQKRLAAALEALLSPLQYERTDDWRRVVLRRVAALVGADKTAFLLPLSGEAAFFSEDYDDEQASAFPDQVRPLAQRWRMWERQATLGVFWRDGLWHPNLKEYYASAYYNDYIRSIGAFDPIGMAVALHGEPSSNGAVLWCHHEREDSTPFGERGLALLRLLHPTFVAGVRMCWRFGATRDELARTLDDLGFGLLLFGADRRLLHANPSAAALIETEPERERLAAEANDIARALSNLTRGGGAASVATAEPVAREVRTRCGTYRLRGCVAGERPFGYPGAVVVALERVGERMPSVRDLRERFSLTRKQAEVALLLAEGRSNSKIAETLLISPHTARHHTEDVLLKLGVHSRAEVGSRIRQQQSG